jgi:AcrR family transcriptional regulator
MTSQAAPTTEPRTPLSRERVLRAAIRLADEGGFESLSMRKLGQELGVQAMSLYNHVAGKDDIRDGIVDIVWTEIEIARGPDWKAGIRASAISAHDALVAHRWACSLMMKTTAVSLARMRWMESILGTLREGGFSANLTHHAYHALDSHITGFTLWQVSFPFETEAELVDMAQTFLREFPLDEYPYVAEHVVQHLPESKPDDESEFEFGLDLILDGRERLRDAAA